MVAESHPVTSITSVAVTLKRIRGVLAPGKGMAIGQAQAAFVHVRTLPVRPLGRVGGRQSVGFPQGHRAVPERSETREVPREAPSEDVKGKKTTTINSQKSPNYWDPFPLPPQAGLLLLNNLSYVGDEYSTGHFSPPLSMSYRDEPQRVVLYYYL